MFPGSKNHDGSPGLFPVGETLKEELNHSQHLA